MKVLGIIEEKKIYKQLKQRNLFKQYKKSKEYILKGMGEKVNLKEKKPKGSGIYYFRINKQYRALGVIKEGYLVIFRIDNHQ